jgi:FkbM family methyltransferase
MKRLLATLMLAARVRPSGRFVIRQLRGAGGVHRYRLRGTPYEAFIRHDGDDAFVLEECFGRLRGYEPPREVAASLDRAEGPLRIADLGANIGLFGLLAISRWPDAEVTGFEPDPANADLHERCIEANGLGERWRLVRSFAAAGNGQVPFARGRSSRSRAARRDEDGGREVEAVDVFPHLQDADLVKIDIEGGEWELLEDERLARLPARAMVLEYHRFRCPETEPERAALTALESAGYRTHSSRQPADVDDPHEGLGTIWAWR